MERKIRVGPSRLLICGHRCSNVIVSCQRALPHSHQDFSKRCGRGDVDVCAHQPAKNSVQIWTGHTFSPGLTQKLITINHHNKLLSILRTAHRIGVQKGTACQKATREDIYRLTKSAKNRQHFTVAPGKRVARKENVRVSEKMKKKMRPMTALGRIICCRPSRK